MLRMGLSFVALLLSQFYYLIVNYHHFEPAEFGLWYGMSVFLISAVCFVNAPLLVLEMFPHPWRLKSWYRKALRLVFISTNTLALAANLADAHFFAYTLKRSTADVLDMMARDTGMLALVPSFLRDYWPAALILVLLTVGLVWADKRIRLRFQARERLTLAFAMRHTLLFVLVFGLAVFVSRGGFRLKPIAPISANGYTIPANVPLALNTPFTVIRTMGSGTFSIPLYMTPEEAAEVYAMTQQIKGMSRDTPPNVVVIILESFGNEFVPQRKPVSVTPFLDSLLGRSLCPLIGMANGQRSIDALPAIISGIPCLMNAPFVSSVYGGNQVESIPKKLDKMGYYSSFFHGGNNGTMGFDDYTRSAGFDKYIGLNEYPDPNDNDGTWGVYDEPFLQFSIDKISSQKAPFFSCIFTLSSHHPYSVPAHLASAFPEGLSPLERSISYTDYSLKMFFQSAARTSWFQNTVFVITADHSPASDHPFFRNEAGRFLVPVGFYSANPDLIPKSVNPMVQHADLPAAILHLAGYNGPFFSVGKNPFYPQTEHVAACFTNEIFQMNDGRYLYQFDGEKTLALFDWPIDSLLTNNLADTHPELVSRFEIRMKALLTNFGTAISTNKMTTE